MIPAQQQRVEEPSRWSWRSRWWSPAFRSADWLFETILSLFAIAILALVALIAYELWTGSTAARHTFGWHFITGSEWDPVDQVFNALPYVYGTLVTSTIALLLAGPIGVGTAVFLVELSPRRFCSVIGFMVELLAAIPSVVYGLWALFVLVPIVRTHIEPFLERALGFLPLFEGPKYGVGLLAAGLVLAIMVLPTITVISQAVLRTVPRGQMEGAYALGATRWEAIRGVALPFSRSGIAGALILGLGRALGETMAVTMVIGNRGEITASIFALGDTMASVIANQFTEADTDLYTSALIEVGLVLFFVTVAINICARLLVWRIAGPIERRS